LRGQKGRPDLLALPNKGVQAYLLHVWVLELEKVPGFNLTEVNSEDKVLCTTTFRQMLGGITSLEQHYATQTNSSCVTGAYAADQLLI
jgi:hypothetical protein